MYINSYSADSNYMFSCQEIPSNFCHCSRLSARRILMLAGQYRVYLMHHTPCAIGSIIRRQPLNVVTPMSVK